MLERGIVSRILFPVPQPSYTAESFPKDLIWVPLRNQKREDTAAPRRESSEPPVDEGNVPCLLLTYPSARFLIIFFHSNAEDLGRCRHFCCYLREQFQVHVLAVEYPGYGICPGIPCGETVMENALSALRFATDTLKWPLDNIKVFGRSIGTGPAIGLASLFNFAGVILVTPFLSIQELFRDRVGPFAGLVEEWFANQDAVTKISSPTMIIHGQKDELISCRHGETIYELLRSRKLLVSPPEMEHNTNLLTNLQFFVLPMFQFFALPDYVFQEMHVPQWAFDKRRCPSHKQVGQNPTPNGTTAEEAAAAASPSRPRSSVSSRQDDAEQGRITRSSVSSGSLKTPRQSVSSGTKDAEGTKALGQSVAKTQKQGATGVTRERRISSKTPAQPQDLACEEPDNGLPRNSSNASLGSRSALGRSGSGLSSDGTKQAVGTPAAAASSSRAQYVAPEAKEALRKIEEFAGKLCNTELCSDRLCALEDQGNLDADEQLRLQEQALERLVQERRQANALHREAGGAATAVPLVPRLFGKKTQPGERNGTDDALLVGWCSKGRPTSECGSDQGRDASIGSRSRSVMVDEDEPEPAVGGRITRGVVRPVIPTSVTHTGLGRTCAPTCEDGSVWLRWCGADRHGPMIDLHEADAPESVLNSHWATNSPRGPGGFDNDALATPSSTHTPRRNSAVGSIGVGPRPLPRRAPGQAPPAAPPPDAPSNMLWKGGRRPSFPTNGATPNTAGLGRGPFMAACCSALPSDPMLNLAPQPPTRPPTPAANTDEVVVASYLSRAALGTKGQHPGTGATLGAGVLERSPMSI